MRIRQFTEDDTEQVVALWHACGLTRPWNDPHRDIARKLAVQRELFFVGETDAAAGRQVIATVMAGYDGHRGWVNYLAVSPDARGAGHGRTLMTEVERRLTAAGCPKLSLLVRDDNEAALGFYRALGYDIDPVVALGKRLIPDG